MPRNITVTLANGSQHVYANAPDEITPQQVMARAQKDFGGVHVASIDGGRPADPEVQRWRQQWSHVAPGAAAAIVQRFQSRTGGAPTNDPRIIALQQIAGNSAPIKQPQKLTRTQQITAAGRAQGEQVHRNAPDLVTSLTASATRNLLGIPERIAAAGERFLPSAITGNTSNANYDDILQLIRARTDAQMGRSTAGNILGAIVGGVATGRAAGGALSTLGTRAAAASSPILARAGNVLQNLITVKKGQTAANAARVITAGTAAGGAQAAGEGSDIGKGAAYGAVGAAALGGGIKVAQVVSRPFRDFLRISSAGQILSRLTSATQDQLEARAAAYRRATGAEPTVFELLPLADRNKVLGQAVVGRDNVVESASKKIRERAANLGPEMSERARMILQPNREKIQNQMLDDISKARGAVTPTKEDAALVSRAMDSPTDMSEFRDQEARAIMAPHDNTQVVDKFSDVIPQSPQSVGKGKKATIQMVESDPAVSAAIKSAAPGGFRAGTSGENPAQPVTVADISSMIDTLKGDLAKGGIEGRTAQRAIDHLTGVLEDQAPEAAAAHARMTDAYASRSRMMEGLHEGDATRLRDQVQVGTNRRQARIVRNAYDTPEGTAGRALGQGNQVMTSLGGSPEEALRATVGISRNSTGRQLEQNVGEEPAARIMNAARAQDESAQALAAASGKVSGSGGDNGNAETLVQAIVGLHPSSFITTKAGAVRKLLDMTYIPENRARTMVDMLFSQDPDMVRRSLAAIGNSPNGSRFLQYMGGIAGVASGSSGEAGGTLPQPPEAPPSTDEGGLPEPAAEVPDADEQAVQPVDPASSPYIQHLQQINDNENPDMLSLIDRQFHQESGNRQFDENGQPMESSKGAIGLAQVMPTTAPQAATLAGLPWDEKAYRNDPVYNKLLGIAYMSEQLRKYDGDVAKALAAYNAGPTRVDNALAGGGNWLEHLPAETQNYVAKVL